MTHKINAEGLALIKASEGLRLNAYYDSVGVLTIGYGTTNACKDIIGTIITPAMTITKDTAERWLEATINSKYMPKVDKYDSKYKWTDNEASALCSFAYNIGSIDQLTANGTRTKAEIASKMLAYNKAGGKVLAGLTVRREKERALFLKAGEAVNASGVAYPTLKAGMNGNNVELLQKNLNAVMPFEIPVSGQMDNITVSTLSVFQYMKKLTVDGIYGNKSYTAMQEALKEAK